MPYAGVLLPLLDTVAVLHDEWHYVHERLYGLVAGVVDRAEQYEPSPSPYPEPRYGLVAGVVNHADQYVCCEPHIRDVLGELEDVYEMLALMIP